MIKDPLDTVLQKQLDYLKLPYCQENFRSLAAEAHTQHWTHLDYRARLVEGEAAARQDRAVLRRLNPTSRIRGAVRFFLWRKSLIFREGSSQKSPKPAVVKTNPILKKSFL